MKIMRKTLWALPVATVLAMSIGVPTASAATRTLTVNSHYVSASDTQNSDVVHMTAGDCFMDGSLIVGRPAGNGLAKIRFTFNTRTSHTNHFDQWHNSWKIVGFGNQPIATVNTLDGFRMFVVNEDYSGEIVTSVPMTPNQWLNMAAVTWTGSC